MDNSCEKSEFLNKDKSKFDLDILAYFVSTSQLFNAFQADNRDYAVDNDYVKDKMHHIAAYMIQRAFRCGWDYRRAFED